ncbi:MAG: hypothetical protein AAGG51_28565 [Cyanobacteria bacterium P01_G01_bin.54]
MVYKDLKKISQADFHGPTHGVAGNVEGHQSIYDNSPTTQTDFRGAAHQPTGNVEGNQAIYSDSPIINSYNQTTTIITRNIGSAYPPDQSGNLGLVCGMVSIALLLATLAIKFQPSPEESAGLNTAVYQNLQSFFYTGDHASANTRLFNAADNVTAADLIEIFSPFSVSHDSKYREFEEILERETVVAGLELAQLRVDRFLGLTDLSATENFIRQRLAMLRQSAVSLGNGQPIVSNLKFSSLKRLERYSAQQSTDGLGSYPIRKVEGEIEVEQSRNPIALTSTPLRLRSGQALSLRFLAVDNPDLVSVEFSEHTLPRDPILVSYQEQSSASEQDSLGDNFIVDREQHRQSIPEPGMVLPMVVIALCALLKRCRNSEFRIQTSEFTTDSPLR